MGIGVISLQTSQKRELSGPPFVSGSANNGLSVDTIAGTIVLGNDVGAVGSPAQLLSNREIVTEDALLNLFAIILNSIQTGITTRLNGQDILIAGTGNTTQSISVTGGGAGSTNSVTATGVGGSRNFLGVASGADRLDIETIGAGAIDFIIGGLLTVWHINTATFFTQIGPIQVTDNGATLQVSGDITYRSFLESHGVGVFNIDRDIDSGKIFRNSAATNYTYPNMVGANFRLGFTNGFCCNNVAGLTITASAGQTIRFGSLATSSGGTLSTTDVGAFCRLTLQDSATWFTESFNGAWVLT